MIQANELRIGNLVSVEKTALHYAGENFKSALFEIEELKKEVVHFKGFHAGEYYKDLQPIPLSEEILLKCGFTKAIGSYFIQKVGSIYVKVPFEGSEYFLVKANSGDKLISVKYLHHLQNLIFALTGEELEFSLT